MPVTTKDKIFEIADELDGEGQKPTLAAVRKRLGRGSYTTISEAMGEWKARKATKERPANEPAPQPLVDQITELAGQIWTSALELANGRVESERENLAVVRAQIETEKTEAVELADHITAELDAMKNRDAALEESEKVARSEADSLRIQVISLSERVAISEARTAEIEKRAADLNRELARVNDQNRELVKALARSMAGKERSEKTPKKG